MAAIQPANETFVLPAQPRVLATEPLVLPAQPPARNGHMQSRSRGAKDGVKEEGDEGLKEPLLMLPQAVYHQKQAGQEIGSRQNVLWFSIFTLGVGTLVGWNSLLAAVDFFRITFVHSPNAAVWFTWTFEVATFMALGALSTRGERYSFAVRFGTGFTIVGVVLILIPTSIALLPEHVAWAVTLALVSVLAIGSGMTEGSLYGFAATVGNADTHGNISGAVEFATPAQAGQGFAGVLICFIRIGTKGAFSQNDMGAQISGVVFFGVSAAISLLCAFIGNRVASHLPPVKVENALSWREKSEVAKKVARYGWSQILINGVTMAVFPSLATSTGVSTFGFVEGWLTVILITLYSVADTVGNLQGVQVVETICHWTRSHDSEAMTLILSGARFAFIPPFVALGAEWVKSDSLAMGLTLLLGYTNGCLSVVCMTRAPEKFDGSKDREREHAGYAMVVSLLMGVTLGATLAIPLNIAVLGHA